MGKLMNRKKTKNLKKPTLSVVNAGHPDTEFLYYLLDVEGVTLKGSLLPAHKKQIIAIIIIRISTNIAFIFQFQFSFELYKTKINLISHFYQL